ncbi:MAG TPA: squalene synthase HpnC [Gammaproteobacteria bacterium]|nr:squalene synthase HpnC [Gammaproteobacteria bacterium]
MTPTTLAAAYQFCQNMARKHYENFPVASLLLPARLRKHVAAIYAFARQADDLADEGNISAEQRLQALQEMTGLLHQCQQARVDDPLYLALADTIQQFSLPVSLFDDLISAFSQDVTRHRYTSFDEVLHYCQRSANPVGRLMLYLHGQTDDLSFAQSDNICTALQLINFYQDLHQDYHELGRIYIPLQDMAVYGVTEQHFEKSINDDAMRQLMQLQYHRAEQLLLHGSALGTRLDGRCGLEIRLIIAGGERILIKLANQKNHFSRPRLNLPDKLWMLQTALLP